MSNEFDFLSPGIKIREIDESVMPAETVDDGPIIIGRTRKGPAMEPVRVKSLDAFIKTFGKPAPGGVPANSDIWRDGPNTSAPTYAAYAAQAWLASGNGPCTIVRLLGDETDSGKTGAGYAGWQLANSKPDSDAGDNSTAYGLFIIDSASVSTKTGSLAAIFYCDSGYMTLSGTIPSSSANASNAATFIKSNHASMGFGIDIWDSSADQVGSTINFNFDRSSPKYIRNVFNTNPQMTNSTIMDNTKTYWLGESFERSFKQKVTGTTAGSHLGVLLPLHRKDASSNASGNWGYNRTAHSPAKTGWIIGRDTGATGSYSNESLALDPLFRFCSLHGGDDLQKEILIAIEDISLPSNSNVDGFPTFSVSVMDINGNTLEKYTKCNLNISSPNYVKTRIGDFYADDWDETNKKYSYSGDEMNHSNYIRIDMAKTSYESVDVPWGFTGPERPVGFMVSGSHTAILSSAGTATTKPFVMASGSSPTASTWPTEDATAAVSGLHTTAGAAHTAKFEFPSLLLREAGSDGNAPNPYKVYWGVRPKISTNSNIHDVDYSDYVRALPGGYKANNHKAAGTALDAQFEYSFIFSLDDIKIAEETNTVTYASGSRKAGTSYTAMSGANALINKKVKQFVMPLYGGRHGLDIKEMEPFRNSAIESETSPSADETKSSKLFTLNKAIDSASDPEVVPGNLLLAPGFYDTNITDKLMTVAEARQDVLTIIDVADDYVSRYESKDAMSTRRGSVSSAITSFEARNINNTYACAFYPWVQIIDVLNSNQRVWIPSSIAGLGGIAQSEAASAAWFAPAGFNRGGLGALGGRSGPIVTQARQRLDSDERDDLYDRLNINPIATFPNEGVVIFGQKTLQQGSNSALSRINVRRLLIYLKARISTVARNIIFDANVPATWARFVGQADPILASVKARFGLTDYQLVLDETTTTADLIDKNVLYAQIYLKPARAIEYIAIDFIVTRTGASFV